MRRFEPPARIIRVAQSCAIQSSLIQDLAQGLPLGQVSLEAIVASVAEPTLNLWAADLLNKSLQVEQDRITQVLVASGFDEMGCSPSAYGILDPDYDGERIVAVVRADARPDTWQRITASGWESCDAPVEMPYLDLRGDVLADALEACAAGASLLLHPSDPSAWLSTKNDPQVIAAAAVTNEAPAAASTIYAVVDPLNTSAVLSLFQVLPGPKISVRTGGAWVPDNGTLTAQLTGLNPPPVVSVSTPQVPDVVRQVDDFQSTHPQSAAAPNGGQAPQATAPPTPPTPYNNTDDLTPSSTSAPAGPTVSAPSVPAPVTSSARPDGLKAAGLAVVAKDTGRVFMLQRGLDEPDDPAKGTWEFPGGNLEGDETPLAGAQREWKEETGHPLPPAINNPEAPENTWNSSNGVYRGHAHAIAHESEINLADRKIGTNPDDPDGDSFEAAAWMQPNHLANNPAVRIELQHDTSKMHSALDGWLPADAEEPLQPGSDDSAGQALAASSMHHTRRVREARDADAAFDADRAATDLAEQARRRNFETHIASRYNTLRGEGTDESTASASVRREIEAEDARRGMWEQNRKDSLLGEKERRLRAQPEMRLSKELTNLHAKSDDEPTPAPQPPGPNVQVQPVVADAIPRTMLPHQLFNYWVHGTGAVKIKWGIKGDWQRCRDHLTKYVKSDYQTKALCAELHKFATGRWTGSKANKLIEGGKA